MQVFVRDNNVDLTIIDEFNSFDAALEPSIDFDLLPEFFQQNRPNSDISDYAPA